MAAESLLVADIGGTHARFGIAVAGTVGHERTLECTDFSGPAAAAAEYLSHLESSALPTEAVFAVASPVDGDRIEMTNHVWNFSVDETRRRLDLSNLRVINDFTALALALPVLGADELRPIKGGERLSGAPMAVLGPGTGLGVSALIPVGETWKALATEGGHRDLAAVNDREWRIIELLRHRFERVSAERVLSGPGLLNLYAVLCELDGVAARAPTPQEITHRAQAAGNSREAEALHLFSGWLGAVAGDLVLTLGARGGLFLGGGMLPKLGALFDAARFIDRFLAKGRFRSYLEPVPVDLIVSRTAALRGAPRAVDHEPSTG